MWLSNITIHHKGGVSADDLKAIDEAVGDEKEKEYPEATMWGNLPAKGFYVRHARNINFDNVVIQTAQFVETGGKRQIVQQGRYEQLWLRVTNDCLHNSHRFYYSTDGENFVAAGESFPMRAGFWKGIRVGLFCYSSGHNMSAGRPKSANKAYFDSFEQKINQ